jgi:hypothetical protein
LADESKFTGEPPLVEFINIEIMCPDRPQGPIKLEFTDVRMPCMIFAIVEKGRYLEDSGIHSQTEINYLNAGDLQSL